MQVLHDNVLVTQKAVEQKTTSGLILSSSIETGQMPATVIAISAQLAEKTKGSIQPKQVVYLDWSKAMAIELDGVKCAVIAYSDIKLIVG